MIFKQVDAILTGQKWQTRRVCKPVESHNVWHLDDERENVIDEVVSVHPKPDKYGLRVYSKWVVGRTYAVVPKRGLPAVWWKADSFGDVSWSDGHITKRAGLTLHGWQPARIRITAIRQERLQDITESDARAEGVNSVAEYSALWDSINGKTKGARWADNPRVWVLEFELVRDGA